MARLPLTLRPATDSDCQTVLTLIEGAARWLTVRGTDQWTKPWPDEQRRNARVRDDLRNGKTWLACDESAVAATITLDPEDGAVWSAEQRREPAVYFRRLVVGRPHSGLGLGARLIDWAADCGRTDHQARWIRVDVWTTNDDLHGYFRALGFDFAGLVSEPDYPSRVLFQRSTAEPRPDYRDVIKPERLPGWR